MKGMKVLIQLKTLSIQVDETKPNEEDKIALEYKCMYMHQ